ncbi:LuxR family two component transcriptional regulator [Vibrio crassostreae]|uniref:EAL domain-containing protein n=1 Tax=Vibrio crassostreae TaxID=246167 RepID=UPI0011993C98|nr:EAL domain-containing protein [Vibrio crassostreae]TWD40956.1 LuxR family two component transcriptional regulator [Vibrio crassostreae]
MKILIIEDDLIQSTSLKFQLEQLSMTDISIANSGYAALELLKYESFDLAFCDIRMPGTDGIKLLSSQTDINGIKGVVITSSVDDVIREVTRGVCNMMGYDFVDIMSKPFTSVSVQEIIERYQTHKTRVNKIENTIEISEQDIHFAFQENWLFVLYQPQFNFRTGELYGVEALVRMEHPNIGIVQPCAFLPLIDKLGFEKELFVLVLSKAAKAMSSSHCVVRLSVNISQCLLDSELCDLVLGICHENDFPAGNLTLELTEEQAYTSTPQALANLARLRLYGVKISIDDFGTGFASLDKLVDFPFTELKIDRKFISNIKNNYKLQQITLLSLKLAQSLGMNCVAEGVENLETWEFLKELGVDICQGYYTGKPMHMAEVCNYAELYRMGNSDETQTYEHITLLVCDRYTESTHALSRSLEKSLVGAKVFSSNGKNQVLSDLRDLPIGILVCDLQLFSEIKLKLKEYLINSLSVVILADKKEDVVDIRDENISIVIRSLEFGRLEKNVVSKVSYITHGNNSLHSRFSQLSEREADVVKLLIAGFSNKYISYELGINQKTVSTYKTRVLQKLGVKSTVDLVKYFNDQG